MGVNALHQVSIYLIIYLVSFFFLLPIQGDVAVLQKGVLHLILCGFSMCALSEAYPDHRLGETFIERNPPPPNPECSASHSYYSKHVISILEAHQVMTISSTYLITVEDKHLSET